MAFHSSPEKEVLRELQSSKEGLSAPEAQSRLAKYGPNELVQGKKKSLVKLFLSQFASILVWILVGAVVISLFLEEYADAVIILVILILNACIGFFQEFKAEKAIDALKRMVSLKAKALRDGKQAHIAASELVPGDIIFIEAGDKVPSDARLLELNNLHVQEAALTGESLPVKKQVATLAEKMALGDMVNMVFSGTAVSAGKGVAVVTSTGMQTQIGKIATLLERTEDEQTPLQRKLAGLGKVLGGLTIAVAIIVFVVGILTGKEWGEMLLTAVSLAVAAIPEGLPAVVTISLALGIQRMIRRNALIRKLPSVETLGSTSVICSDKTGTLTCNQMTVRKMLVNNKVIEVTGEGYETKGAFHHQTHPANPSEFELLLRIGALCNDARLDPAGNDHLGDPTELALLVTAEKAGISVAALEREEPRVDENGFTSESKRMATLHKGRRGTFVYMKGAPDVIINHCSHFLLNGIIMPLAGKQKEAILKVNEAFSHEALRVLGFAYKKASSLSEEGMVFVGLQAMIDPPRTEVKAAIATCHDAGIKVVMITGDYIGTAMAIAAEIGIKGKAITGQELEGMSNLDSEVEDIAIYARVNPEHKLRIVDALKKNGHIVAMTGDGVNDAPALKKADIGVAMGITGTDVSKEASDMILTDDNFASIVNAVEEGRGIYDNIQKFVNYLLSSNIGEILVIFVAILIGMPLPLLAVHLLWVNLVTDGFPALALGVDPAEKGIMRKPPKAKSEHIINARMGWTVFVTGAIIAAGTLYIFNQYLPDGLETARTAAFTMLVLFEFGRLIAIRMRYHIGIFCNKWLNIAVLVSLCLHLIVLYSPLNRFFEVIPLGPWVWVEMTVVAALMPALALAARWTMGRRQGMKAG
ncbi:TPA: calcium-translocating P-type ATPase, SERCA-type [Candidatus Woesearchaeota archaeon]|nr:calcium-translocating P-type ATPase, SERCA-type [Candidatus Woesearchaeota archaeon]HII68262.1 calcium-translocating P-type ATPase, SERCA-type [Candidatus Woesearchaeota archaeon]